MADFCPEASHLLIIPGLDLRARGSGLKGGPFASGDPTEMAWEIPTCGCRQQELCRGFVAE